MIKDKYHKKVADTLTVSVELDSYTNIVSDSVSLIVSNDILSDGILSFDLDGGEDGIEHIITIDDDYQIAVLVNKTNQLYYGTVHDGDIYFDEKLENDLWVNADFKTKKNSLIEATRLIERLPFQGCKTSSSQLLEFPRGGDVEVPTNIVYAIFEIAYQLLNDITADSLLHSARVTMSKYETVQTQYDPRYIPEHVLVGIPSAIAWSWIKPYIRDGRDLALKRIS